MQVQRIGQEIFRSRLMGRWGGKCPLTGISEPELLRASHIIPWAECATDAERLDPDNGLLLSALWDAAFNRGLVTFTDAGEPLYSNKLSEVSRSALATCSQLSLLEGHRNRLAWHRQFSFKLD